MKNKNFFLKSADNVKNLAIRNSKKNVLSISTWFCAPEHGMKDMEILCRGSAFIVPSISTAFKSKYHIITSSHVASPWLWPNYYTQEWLRELNETHSHYTIELRQDDGVFMTQIDLKPSVYHHPTRDLAVLHLEEKSEQKDLELLQDLGYQKLLLSEQNLLQGQVISVYILHYPTFFFKKKKRRRI
jgi:hypothetical protein